MSNQIKRLFLKTDTAVGWTRTSVQAFVTSALVWVAANLFDRTLDVTDPLFVVVAGASAAVVWRGSMYLATRVPALGWVLFGVNKAPGYQDSPPLNPSDQVDPPTDSGSYANGGIVPGASGAEFGGFVGD